MNKFLNQNYLLSCKSAERLYHDVAKDLPIIDYHNHLSPQELAENRIYNNFYEGWLAGDHYKWRAMRWMGVSEELITGNADPYEKFYAWAKTVPALLRSPLYAWTHLELRKYFGINLLLSEKTAKEIWQETNHQLPKLPIRKILDNYRVAVAGTTDDPTDDLVYHKKLKDLFCKNHTTINVVPTFRPDPVYNLITNPSKWVEWINKLVSSTGIAITDWESLISALLFSRKKFGVMGCKSSDHGLISIPDCPPDEKLCTIAVGKLLQNQSLSHAEQQTLTITLLYVLGKFDFQDNWSMQIHLGPLRSVNTAKLNQCGINIGCDVMGEDSQVRGLLRLFDALSQNKSLPQTIIYNINPNDNAAFATLIGAFQGVGKNPGHLQFGSGWWFLDQEDGMRRQIEDLSNFGVLSTFVGMFTDSRSSFSFVRHEMFRRILCDIVGKDIENGRIPDDVELTTLLVKNICFTNAKNYFGFDIHSSFN